MELSLLIKLFLISTIPRLHGFSKPLIYIDNEDFKGTLIGLEKLNVFNETYSAFLGLPYAKPPVGLLRFRVSLQLYNSQNNTCPIRIQSLYVLLTSLSLDLSLSSLLFILFQDPQVLDKFEGIFQATQEGFECHSITARNASEDCLYLNVYTKQVYNL